MASAEATSQEQTKPLEEKVADLKIGDKSETVTDAVYEHADGVPQAAKTSADDAAAKPNQVLKESSEESKPSEKPSQFADSREVDIAEKEAQKSPDKDAYVVPAIDHRTVQEPGGEEKVDVPTGVVHESVDSTENHSVASTGGPPEQGKGIVHSITRSVKNVFSGISGAGKGTKNSEGKEGAATE